MIAPANPQKGKDTRAEKTKPKGLRWLIYDSQVRRATTRVLDALGVSTSAVILNREEAQEVIAAVIADVMAEARGLQASVSQIASKKASSESRQRRLRLLHDWLDRNLYRFKGRLDSCAINAVQSVKGLGWSVSMVRREISSYRRSKKLDGC